MELAGVVILFNPDEGLLKRIQSYRHQVKKLYIIDNSAEANIDFLKPLINESSVRLLHDAKNEGIGKRLNEAATNAIKDGFDWLLTMDQDSTFDKEAFDGYLKCIMSYNHRERVAMFGVEYDKKLRSTAPDCMYTNVTHLITSGSLVNLRLFSKVGGFDEGLFIDHVDHDYCFRSIIKGCEIIKLNNISFTHSLGSVSDFRSLKNFKLTPRALHPAQRIYYMVRNYFFLKKKYGSFFNAEMIAFKKHLFNRIKNNLLYNKQKALVLKYVFKGYMDFKKGIIGKLRS